jgi:uroporphyrinogen-III decarboxylase
MTSKERLTRLFNEQEIDRVPIWLLHTFHRLGYYADIYNNPVYKKAVPYIREFGDILNRRNYNFGLFRNANEDIKFEQFEQDCGNETRVGTKIKYKDFELCSYTETKKTTGQRGMKYYIDDIDQLEKIAEIPYFMPEADTSCYLKEKEELGERGLMMADLGDPLGILYTLMNPTDFSMYTLTDYDKLITFTDVMYERVLYTYKYLLERDICDVFFIIGAEFAGPPLVSPDKFNELSVRYVKGIVDLIRSYGKKSIVHYHGNLYHVRDGMKAINPDGLHTVEAPPIGDCTITQAREKLDNMILIGNIQYDDIRSFTQEQMRENVKNVIEEAKEGRFILSTTAGPYEDNPTENFVNNYIELIKAGIEYGKLK